METLFYAYACFTCKDRGPDLAEAANDYGFTARYIVGGKLRLSKMTA